MKTAFIAFINTSPGVLFSGIILGFLAAIILIASGGDSALQWLPVFTGLLSTAIVYVARRIRNPAAVWLNAHLPKLTTSW